MLAILESSPSGKMVLCMEPKSAFLNYPGIVIPVASKVGCVEGRTRPSLEVKGRKYEHFYGCLSFYLKKRKLAFANI